MFFRVENLGPLRSAEVDLSKEIILLTGPNSTGKTYLAWSVYGLFRDPDAPDVFRGLVKEILDSPEHQIEIERVMALWPSLLEAIAGRLASRLHLCFAAERQSFADVKVSIRSGSGEPAARQPEEMTFLARHVEGVDPHISIGSRLKIELITTPTGDVSRSTKLAHREAISFMQIPADAREELTEELTEGLGWLVMSRYWPLCTLLPTERTAVDMFAKELSIRRWEMINRAVEGQLSLLGGAELASARLGVATRDVGRYPWPIQDSLRAANDLASCVIG
jgi:hypothetical protein